MDGTRDQRTGEADEPLAERKRRLRAALRARRRELYGGHDGAARRASEGAEVRARATELVGMITPSERPLVAVFHPTPTEPDVMPLVRALVAAGARPLFPVLARRSPERADGAEAESDPAEPCSLELSPPELDWAEWDGSSPLRVSPGRGFGLEPDGPRHGSDALARARLVLVPALAVDLSGTRLGHGAGYYDRALTHLLPGTAAVAVVHPHEVLEPGVLPRADHDIPISEAITAAGRVSLRTP